MAAELTGDRIHLAGQVLSGVGPSDDLPDGVSADWWAEPRGTDGGVWEFRLRLFNVSDETVTVTHADAFTAELEPGRWRSLHFESAWGGEFEPVVEALEGALALRTSAGRSSLGIHPWLGLERDGAAVVITVAWSGNWHIDVDGLGGVTAGISPADFAVALAPGESFEAPAVLVSVATDIESAGLLLVSAVGADMIPRSQWSERMPTEWNHWWPYEDVDIDQAVFLAESLRAVDAGLEVATLDAGWFGRPEASSDWQLERGDWDQVNSARFPSGLPALADAVRASGAEFGIWMEAEAVGAGSRLRREHPELLALRRAPAGHQPTGVGLDPDDPTFLGYVCLGSAESRRFVADALDRAVSSTGATWLKLDFNVDPGSGCDRTDHGHGAGDGLLRHYQGLYRVLDEFREAHPEVILEACSSGGLRIDLGLAQHVHCLFLSDPDWTEHHLQVLWGASLMLPPAAMLHWSWSEWRGDNPDQAVDFGAISASTFDAMLRAAMLQRFGVSMKLTGLRDDLFERLREHVAIYRDRLAPLVRAGRLRRLTAAPLRHGRGERAPRLQLELGTEHLLAAFQLDGQPVAGGLRFTALEPDARYRVEILGDGAAVSEESGRALMEAGIEVVGPATSWLILASRIKDPEGRDD
ncbi:alpha-galactosidase [Amnibacterium flavum]|uniref:alpha-galactosidase n=1 Tax=Amnibacterium flavum TaxID=2173173 RepID=A0A2V1HRR4_9MICO|nr:alpha-galactosidase [Amnibacterium flavum]PVZ95293.1 alpha-galactosidase [Amnibacterium flavum]